jgi:Na+/H+ antiporter NhaD/arsenite permease-like protein
MTDQPRRHRRAIHRPWVWGLSALIGLTTGALLAQALPGEFGAHGPLVPAWLVLPFVLLLASIALMPFIHARLWHRHYPDVAFALGGFVAGYYLAAFRFPPLGLQGGDDFLVHALKEYYAFMALVGGLFVVSGGILVDIRGRGGPMLNTMLLLTGSLLGNIVGTTGASMLLLRPFMRINRGRLRPLHVVFFIFLVSNCAGCLTPIGDPPLYLGFLKGVPFLWTLTSLWEDWLLVTVLILVAFLAYDASLQRRQQETTFSPLPTTDEAGNLMEAELRAPLGLRLRGGAGLVCLALMIVGVFVDPMVLRLTGYEGFPLGATLQVVVAILAHRLAPREILAANDFTFGPIREVALLFLGIFVTMVPALAYVSEHGAALGLRTPTALYYGAGILSAFLDNAPTYANFLQVAVRPEPVNPASVGELLARPNGATALNAVSTGAVFFGAMTYIGNGPNFMVKAIAEASGVLMPSFFGYLARAMLILFPILVIHWLVFIR